MLGTANGAGRSKNTAIHGLRILRCSACYFALFCVYVLLLAQAMSIIKADKKTTALGKLVGQLQEHIDVHRIIGLNCSTLRKSAFREALPGYMQGTALESLAMHICKMFEKSDRNELNSIPGIIDAIQLEPLTPEQRVEFEKIGRLYGNCSNAIEAKSYLTGTFGLFCGVHLDRE